MTASARARWLGYVALIVPFVLSFFTRFAPGTFSADIAEDLGLHATGLGVATGTYFYVYTAMQLPSGLIIDRWGVRWSVAIGTAVAALGLFLYSSAPGLPGAVMGSALIGLGTATSFLGILRANAAWFAGSLFGVMSGLTLLLGNLGSVAAGQPLAALLGVLSWREILRGTAWVCLGTAVLVAVVVRLPSTSSSAPREPGSPLQTLRSCWRDRALLLLILAAVGTNSTFYTLSGLWGTPLLTRGLGMSVTAATSVISVALLVYGLVSVFIGRLADRVSEPPKLVVGVGVLSLVGWLGLAVSLTGSVWLAVLGVCVAGGAAGGVVVAFAVVATRYSGSASATALALVNAAVFLGVAVLQPVVGGLLDWMSGGSGEASLRSSSVVDFVPGVLLLLVVSAFGAVAALRARRWLGAGDEEELAAERR